MLDYIAALPIAGAALSVGLGAFTVSRNPANPANIGLALGLLCLAVVEAGCALILLPLAGPAHVALGTRLFVTGLAALPSAWLFFTAGFSRAEHGTALRRWAPAIFVSSALSLLFVVYSPALQTITLAPESGMGVFSTESPLYVVTSAGRYFYLFTIIGLVLNLFLLENAYRSSAGADRWRIKHLVLGVGSVFAFFIYLSSQVLLLASLHIEVVPLVSAVVLISAGVMALFIVRHRLFDVDIFVSRYVVYNSLTVLIVGAYLIFVGLAAEVISYFDIPLNLFITTLFVFITLLGLVMFLFTTTYRRKIQLYVARHFYSHKYEFRDRWMETIEKISPKISEGEIYKTLKEMVAKTTGARFVYLWRRDPRSGDYVSTDGRKPGDFDRIPSDHPLIEAMSFIRAPFMLADAEAGPAPRQAPSRDGAIRDVMEGTGAILCAPLVAGPDVMGFILMAGDVSGVDYENDDFDFLGAVTTQAAVQLKNIELTSDLVTAKELDLFNKVSFFIMHDLKNLTNSLSLVSQNAKLNIDNPEFQKDAIRTIDGTVARMKGLIEKLSALPKGLEIDKRETPFGEVLEGALKKIPKYPKKPIDIINDAVDLPVISIDPLAIEMVILNIITNACEAINGRGKVWISSSVQDGKLNLKVRDNGPGIPEDILNNVLFKPFKSTKQKGFGIGLYQCKAIVEAHGGCIEMESSTGAGATCTVTLPIR